MIVSPNLGLKIWNLSTDPYSSSQLAENLQKIDDHDHANGRGKQIPTGGIADGAITNAKLDPSLTLIPSDDSISTVKIQASAVTSAKIADTNITTAKIADSNVTTAKLADGSITTAKLDSTGVAVPLGLTDGASIRRGKSIIATTESRTNVAYGTMTTPDQVSNVILPTDGLIFIAYQATIQQSNASAARAAIFIGATQLKVFNSGSLTVATQAAAIGASTASDGLLTTSAVGLVGFPSAAYADVTTGQIIGAVPNGPGSYQQEINGSVATNVDTPAVAGPCSVFAAAGTYNISVQFKASAGSVTVKNRKLWVWTIGF